MLKKIIRWALSKELDELKTLKKELDETNEKVKSILGNVEANVDVHTTSPSWAVISLQGEKRDFIKFVTLDDANLRDIQQFLSQFDRTKVDASPYYQGYLRNKSLTI